MSYGGHSLQPRKEREIVNFLEAFLIQVCWRILLCGLGVRPEYAILSRLFREKWDQVTKVVTQVIPSKKCKPTNDLIQIWRGRWLLATDCWLWLEQRERDRLGGPDGHRHHHLADGQVEEVLKELSNCTNVCSGANTKTFAAKPKPTFNSRYFFSSEICGLGEEASYRSLLTVCSLDEFTCSDGEEMDYE